MPSGTVQSGEIAALELKRRIILFLSQKGIRNLEIEVGDGTVTFQGTVASFYERQLCLSCQHLPGVAGVVDSIEVEG